MTIGMALIVRDEADTIERCLASFWGHVDVVAVLDTGSKDDTLDVVHTFALNECTRERTAFPEDPLPIVTQIVTGTFEWVQDFAAARRAAEALLPDDIEWVGWADADDVIHGAEHLRRFCAEAPPEVAALVVDYDYAQDEQGACVCRLKRERLVRRGRGQWEGRVHEAQVIDGHVQQLPAQLVEWRHRKPVTAGAASNTRNLRILRSWAKTEPQNPRVLMYLGTEHMARSEWRRAARYLRRYLALQSTWDEERAQVHRKLAVCHASMGDSAGAVRVALDALTVLPSWPDSALTLAEAHYELREPSKAIFWANTVLQNGVPDTLLIINPTDYTVQPHVVLAGAHAALGQTDQAIHHAEMVLAAQPGHHTIRSAYVGWLQGRKREQTAETFLACANMLVSHDEQLKALDVLRAVPHYAMDHPNVVALRSALRERLDPLLDPASYADRYATGGSKPEDMVPDEHLHNVGEWLPRAAFLLEGIREQQAAAA